MLKGKIKRSLVQIQRIAAALTYLSEMERVCRCDNGSLPEWSLKLES